MQYTPTRIHENRVRASRTLSDDIKYIYDCVSRVIGPRIFLAILSRYLFLPLAPPCSLDFSLSLSPFFSLSFYFSLPLHPSLGLRRPQQERGGGSFRSPRYLCTHSLLYLSLSFVQPERRDFLLFRCWQLHAGPCIVPLAGVATAPATPFDCLLIVRQSEGHPALPDAANEKNHREGGNRSFPVAVFSPRFQLKRASHREISIYLLNCFQSTFLYRFFVNRKSYTRPGYRFKLPNISTHLRSSEYRNFHCNPLEAVCLSNLSFLESNRLPVLYVSYQILTIFKQIIPMSS